MAEVRFGVVDQVPVATGTDGARAVAETLALARRVEALGYTRYWLAEHHSTNSFACAQPAALIPAVATATSRLRVGSGGVLLPHYSPYEVAEQFRMLEAITPGRIDLGIGRAPGGTMGAVEALRYGRGGIPHSAFTDQARDLIGWLRDALEPGHPFARVRAMPRGVEPPEVWLLGSSGETARLAGALGCGYAFAQFISGVDGSAAARAYRAAFRPSGVLGEARVIVAVGAVCAETDAEAERLASSLRLWRARIETGRDRGIPSPEEALEHRWAPGQLERVSDGERVYVGTPDRVADRLRALAERYEADEVLVVTVTHSYEARTRSYELLAEALALGN
jgi:luciferase family oxidoreductase group 1